MSLRAHLFSWFLQRQLAKGAGAPFSVEGMRRMLDGRQFPLPRRTAREAATVGGVDGEWVRGTRAAPGPRLLYIHGGGFIACSAATHRPVTGAFAQRGFTVFAPNYRLAPEHPFPAGLDDVLAVYRAMAADGPVALAGDSAGGTLALGLIARARIEGLPRPTAAALFSPATDMLGTGASHTENADHDPVLKAEPLRQLLELYRGAVDMADPILSPLYGDYPDCPPLLFHVGEREILRDDSVRLADKVRQAGGTAVLKVYPVVPHAWQLAQAFLPEARDSLERAAAFLRSHGEARGATASRGGAPPPA